MNSIKTILMIGGFVTLFSVIISIIENSKFILFFSQIIGKLLKINPNLISSFIMGIIEFTNGLSKLANIHLKNISINIVISSFIIGFGGISVGLQVLSIINKRQLSIKKYLLGKFFQAIIAVIYTSIIISIPIFNFNILQ